MDKRIDKELDWDSEISYESPNFVTLPEGDYPFTVTELERKRYEGNRNKANGLPACPMAELTIEARGKEGVSTFTTRLYLHTRTEGLLTQFFTCIGQRKHGDKLSMDWNSVVGATGWAHLKVREFTTRQGNEGTSNEIGRWLAPEEAPTAAAEGEDW